MAELSAYLAEKGISKALLNAPVNRESRNQVALRIGKNWESLATCIGIASQEVFDLKETYPNTPQYQRLGMMNRWEELYGSEATYLKLIDGLEQTGRRDLTEFLIGVVMNRPPFGKAKSDEEGRQKAPGMKLNTGGVPSSILNAPGPANKPGYLPLRDPNHSGMLSHYEELGMSMWGRHSEPVKKQVNSPGRMFWTSPQGGPENVAVERRAAVTPERISSSSEAMGHNDVKMFRNHYSGPLLTPSPSTYDNPFSTKTSTMSTSGSYYGIPQPNQPSNSRNIDALVDRLADFNLSCLDTKFNAKENKEPPRRGRLSLPSAIGDIGSLGGGTRTPIGPHNTGAVARTKSEPQHCNDHTSGQGGGVRESVKKSMPQELSMGPHLESDEFPDMNGTSSDSGIEFSTTVPTPAEPTVPPLSSNPQTSLSQDENSKSSGVTESQDAVGSDYLSCGHLRRPSLYSSSSVDSNSSPFPSPEINPIQVSEKSPGEYHPLANDGKRPIRQRCRKCAKLKQEAKTLKEKLDKVQSKWNTEREQNTEQVRGLREELHRQRLDNYELKERVFGTEARHREAMRTIHRLQMELQRMTQLFLLQQTEHARLKEAYDCCLVAKCELLKVQLQRADSMQCPEEVYYENQTEDVSHHGQYSMTNGRNDYTSRYHEQTNTEWHTANLQNMQPSNYMYTHPHAM